jgi:uncharacterized protein (TIGR00369 family)
MPDDRSDPAVAHGPADDGANDRLNDTSNYQRCFGCGARNMAGLRLRFHAEGDTIVTEYTPEVAFQGFPGVVHGGILATLLDETLSRTATAEGRWMMTARLEIRYRHPAPLGRTLRVTARPVSSRARAIQAAGEIRLADEPGVVIATAEGTFLPLTPQYREQAAEDFPEIVDFFQI